MSAILLAARLFLGGLFKSLWSWLSRRSPIELLAMALIILTIWLWISLGHARDEAESQRARAVAAEKSLAELCQATRQAAARPKLDCRQSAAQIRLLGSAIAEIKSAIGSQNAHVAALEAATVAQQASSSRASREAAPIAERALSASDRLKHSSAITPAADRMCRPSKALEEAWR